MQYYEVKIRETKTLVPRDDGSTVRPEKHGKQIQVAVHAFSKKKLNPKNEKLSPQQLGYNAQALIRKFYGIESPSENVLGEIYVDLRSIKKIDKKRYDAFKQMTRQSDEYVQQILDDRKTKGRASKPKPISKTKSSTSSPENRLLFGTIAGSAAFFGLQFAVNPWVAAVLLIFGLVLGPIIVGVLISVALAKEGELNNKGAGFIAAAIFALVSIILLKSDLIDEARNAGSGGSYKSCVSRHMDVMRSTELAASLHCKKAGY